MRRRNAYRKVCVPTLSGEHELRASGVDHVAVLEPDTLRPDLLAVDRDDRVDSAWPDRDAATLLLQREMTRREGREPPFRVGTTADDSLSFRDLMRGAFSSEPGHGSR